MTKKFVFRMLLFFQYILLGSQAYRYKASAQYRIVNNNNDKNIVLCHEEERSNKYPQKNVLHFIAAFFMMVGCVWS